MNWTALLAAIAAVESGGDPEAVGDGGAAWGALQVHVGVLHDVAAAYGVRYRKEDCFVRSRAETLCKLYLTRWCGQTASAEVYARTWNGGPRGMEKSGTVGYWEKVRPIYEGLGGE